MSEPESHEDWTRPSLANWQDPPYNRWAFSHLRELVPVQAIPRGDGPLVPLPRRAEAIDEVEIPLVQGGAETVAGIVEGTYTDGLVIVHDGDMIPRALLRGTGPDAAPSDVGVQVARQLRGRVSGR